MAEYVYAVHSAFVGETNERRIWIKLDFNDKILTKALQSGGRQPIVQIVGPSGKKVFVEALTADTFYNRQWAEATRQR